MDEQEDKLGSKGMSRRRLLTSTVSAAAAMPLLSNAAPVADASTRDAPDAAGTLDGTAVELSVNGQAHRLRLDARTTLLDALREQLGLTGSKKGCDHGQCGACTVHVGGRRVLSCLTLAVTVREPVTTIEGIAAPDGTLHPLQAAFIEHDAFQCGYCTPGQIMSAIACIKEGHAGDVEQIREWMSGNLCRCAAYPNIVAAVVQARGQLEGPRS